MKLRTFLIGMVMLLVSNFTIAQYSTLTCHQNAVIDNKTGSSLFTGIEATTKGGLSNYTNCSDYEAAIVGVIGGALVANIGGVDYLLDPAVYPDAAAFYAFVADCGCAGGGGGTGGGDCDDCDETNELVTGVEVTNEDGTYTVVITNADGSTVEADFDISISNIDTTGLTDIICTAISTKSVFSATDTTGLYQFVCDVAATKGITNTSVTVVYNSTTEVYDVVITDTEGSTVTTDFGISLFANTDTTGLKNFVAACAAANDENTTNVSLTSIYNTATNVYDLVVTDSDGNTVSGTLDIDLFDNVDTTGLKGLINSCIPNGGDIRISYLTNTAGDTLGFDLFHTSSDGSVQDVEFLLPEAPPEVDYVIIDDSDCDLDRIQIDFDDDGNIDLDFYAPKGTDGCPVSDGGFETQPYLVGGDTLGYVYIHTDSNGDIQQDTAFYPACKPIVSDDSSVTISQQPGGGLNIEIDTTAGSYINQAIKDCIDDEAIDYTVTETDVNTYTNNQGTVFHVKCESQTAISNNNFECDTTCISIIQEICIVDECHNRISATDLPLRIATGQEFQTQATATTYIQTLYPGATLNGDVYQRSVDCTQDRKYEILSYEWKDIECCPSNLENVSTGGTQINFTIENDTFGIIDFTDTSSGATGQVSVEALNPEISSMNCLTLTGGNTLQITTPFACLEGGSLNDTHCFEFSLINLDMPDDGNGCRKHRGMFFAFFDMNMYLPQGSSVTVENGCMRRFLPGVIGGTLGQISNNTFSNNTTGAAQAGNLWTEIEDGMALNNLNAVYCTTQQDAMVFKPVFWENEYLLKQELCEGVFRYIDENSTVKAGVNSAGTNIGTAVLRPKPFKEALQARYGGILTQH